MQITGLTHSRLMKASWSCVDAMARNGQEIERQLVRRITEVPQLWQSWEAQHSGLMREVAQQRREPPQVIALRRTSLALTHRMAPFEYLRTCHATMSQRRLVIALFHANRPFAEAMVAEHQQFLRSACSHLCVTHLGTQLMGDQIYSKALADYQELYADYFKGYCQSALNDSQDDASEADWALLPYLKFQLRQLRQAILSAPRSSSHLQREALLRMPTGDTARLPIYKPPA